MTINFFFRKSRLLWDNTDNYDTAWQATDDNTIWYTHFACWISKATDIYTNAPHCYIYTYIICLFYMHTCALNYNII